MLKQKLTIIFIIIFNVTFSQSTQSSNSFEKEILEIKNEQSEYYYPRLLNKIKLNNENISKIDLKFLYYGQIYKTGTGLSFLDNPDEDNFRKSIYQKNCKKILKYGSSNLEKNPVELTTLLPICECQLKNKVTDSNNLDKRLKMILEVIFETGNGKTKETAIKIAKIEDDIIIINLIGFKGGKESFETLEDKVFSVWNNGKEKIYFEDCSAYKYK